MYAFKNSLGDVLAVSSSDVPLAQVQSEIPDVAVRIEGAPFGLVYKGSTIETGEPGYYHRHVSGDGTQLADYERVPDIEEFKKYLCSVADKECASRIKDSGFEWPAGSGNWFSLSLEAQMKWFGMDTTRDVQAYPMSVSMLTELVYDISDAGELHDMYLTAMAAVKAHVGSCVVAKESIMSASDRTAAQAACDAYVNG